MGLMEKCGAGGEWEYPTVVETIEYMGIHPIWEYIRRRKATIADMVDCCPVYMRSAMRGERMTETIWMVQCWEQDAVNEPEEWKNICCNLP